MLLEPDRLGDPQPGAVEELDQRLVAETRGCVPFAASIRRSASPGESVFGSGFGRARELQAAAGLSSRAPSSCW